MRFKFDTHVFEIVCLTWHITLNYKCCPDVWGSASRNIHYLAYLTQKVKWAIAIHRFLFYFSQNNGWLKLFHFCEISHICIGFVCLTPLSVFKLQAHYLQGICTCTKGVHINEIFIYFNFSLWHLMYLIDTVNVGVTNHKCYLLWLTDCKHMLFTVNNWL